MCKRKTLCDDCRLLGALSFGDAPLQPVMLTALHAVLERRGRPEDTVESVVDFCNDVRRAANALA